MCGESRPDDDHLDASWVDGGCSRGVRDVPVIAAVHQSRGPASDFGSGFRVPSGVELFDFIAGSPLSLCDIFVWVGARNENRSIGEQNGSRMVHSLLD